MIAPVPSTTQRARGLSCLQPDNNRIDMKLKMPSRSVRSWFSRPSIFDGVTVCVLATLATLLSGGSANAAFHLWNLREIYTDSSGQYQFIELFTSSSSQQFVGGQQLTVTPTGGGTPHTFTIPSNLPGDTFNHAMLLATSSLQGAGAPAPNYVIPNGFLFAGGGTVNFFGANSGTYTALPTDGVLSRTWGDGNAANTPQNFAGQIGSVVVPEPSVVALLVVTGIGFALRRSFRRSG